jgi:hypothetical protein
MHFPGLAEETVSIRPIVQTVTVREEAAGIHVSDKNFAKPVKTHIFADLFSGR